MSKKEMEKDIRLEQAGGLGHEVEEEAEKEDEEKMKKNN
jgi:hypothetical protein